MKEESKLEGNANQKRIGRRAFETDEQAQNAVFNYYLDFSRKNSQFPKAYDVENLLKMHMSTYSIDSREVKVKVIKKRLEEDVYGQNLDPSEEELNKLFGIGLFRYLEDLGFESLSKLREFHVGKNTRRKFATREEALSSLRKKVKELILKEEYENKDITQREVGTNIETYDIKWKEDVLYPVYNELIKEEFIKNPKTGDNNIRKKYPFSQSFLKSQGGIVTFKIKNKIPVSIRAESMLLRRLILQTLKPKLNSSTSINDIHKFIESKTGKYYNTFKIPQEMGYLRRMKKIEGNIYSGYWSVE